MQGYTSVVYIDNSCLQGGSYESRLKNVNDTIIMLPLLSLIHLGFIINSKDMTLKLTEEKKNKKFMTIIPNLLKNQNPLFNL